MRNKLTLPTIQEGVTDDGERALLLTIGTPRQWPVLISPSDFDMVTEQTGNRAWGIQGLNVVVGDADRACGRRAVVRIIAGITDCRMRPAFRDGNPLNLMRTNIGMRGKGGTFWLTLRPGETDPIHFGGAFPNRTPRAILRQRETARPERDPLRRGHWTQRNA